MRQSWARHGAALRAAWGGPGRGMGRPARCTRRGGCLPAPGAAAAFRRPPSLALLFLSLHCVQA
eukprot:364303-Chlamydomonas_euryale.AAC.13